MLILCFADIINDGVIVCALKYVLQHQFVEQFAECSYGAFYDSVLPMGFSCGHVDFDWFQATVILELFAVETSLFIHVKACWVRHVAGPFLNGRYEVLCVAIAQIGIVSDATFTDDFCCVVFECFVDEMQNYQFFSRGVV